MNELALFAGHGGGILGGLLLGWRTVCAVEIDAAARQRLMARQDDGSLRPFPIWDDVRTFDGKPWAGLVDVISGGFPCQDISVAGKGAGIIGERSGLWREFARIIREVRPRYVLVENSPALVARGLGTVLGDLAQMGFDARWGVLGAVHAGAPHRRERIWIVANSVRYRCQADHGRGFVSDQFWQRQAQKAGWELQQSRFGCPGELANTNGLRQSQPQGGQPNERGWTGDGGEQGGMQWWSAEPDVGRVAHGVANRVDRLRGLGNGQVPAVVALAWETLTTQPDLFASSGPVA
jgi:DNA (cytosine-5)-methyltransferase 1